MDFAIDYQMSADTHIQLSNNNTYFLRYSLVVGTLSFCLDNILAAVHDACVPSHPNGLRRKTIKCMYEMFCGCFLARYTLFAHMIGMFIMASDIWNYPVKVTGHWRPI